MKRLYEKVLALSSHPHAYGWLWFISVIDSFIFPIPPLVMLLPMMLAKPKRAWQYAFATTAGSIIGGVMGYAIGYWFFDVIAKPLLTTLQMADKFACFQEYYNLYGWWTVLIWGFLPMPYKVITIASGFFGMDLMTFILASIVGRSVRYFSIGAVFYYYGATSKKIIDKYFIQTTLILGGLTLLLAYLFHLLNPVAAIC